MELTLVRHGETNWNLENRIQGWMDVGLNEQGRRDARDVAKRLEITDSQQVVSSPLRRAYETAEILIDNSPIDTIQSPTAFRELDQGNWNGLRDAVVRRVDGDRYSEWQSEPLDNPPPDGESLQDVKSRVREGLLGLDLPSDGGIVLVAHKVVNSIVMHLAGDRSFAEVLEELPGNLAVYRLSIEREQLRP